MVDRRVYFIQCHESAERLKLLFRSIYSNESEYIIHCDRKSPDELLHVAASLADFFSNVSLIESRWISWGGYSQVEILIDALRRSIESGDDWSHFVLLSEHHLPVRHEKTFGAFLRSGVSYVSSTRYLNMPDAGKKDILHRFSAEWRELPAWGMFPVTYFEREKWVSETISHGSNWVILCREHCSLIVDEIDVASEIIINLRTSVQSDEMFVQTLIQNLPIRPGSVDRHSLTYVAWPNLSGTNDLTFVGKNFYEAAEKGYLFIRKSPSVVPHDVMETINSFCTLSESELDVALAEPILPDRSQQTSEENLAVAISTECKARRITAIDVTRHNVHFCPSLYLKFRSKALAEGLFVALLSEDLENFKILICWRHQTDDMLQPLKVNGVETHVLKARVAGLIFNREVIVPQDERRGFFHRSDFPTPSLIADYVSSYMTFAKDFSERI